MVSSTGQPRPSFRNLVPLQEVIAEAMGRGPATKGVQALYHRIVQELGPELYLLQEAPLTEISRVAGERLAEGIGRVRQGDITVQPGFDGVYGSARVWSDKNDETTGTLFAAGGD